MEKGKVVSTIVVSTMVLMLFMTSMLTFAFYVQPVTSILPVHNVDTGFDYATIQEAINAPETLDGHTILVDAGVYYENVVLNKTLSLIGENKVSTVIDANNTGNAVTIEADYCIVENFTIQNGGFGVVIMGNSTKRYLGNVVVGNAFRNNVDAIGLSTCDRNVVANNTFEGNGGFNVIVGWVNPFATWDVTSNNNTITRNNMTEGISGVLILYSHHNIVSENNIINTTDQGITFLSKSYYAGPPIVTNNSICNNVIVNCTFGLIMSSESYRGLGSLNNVSGNIVRNTEVGVYIYDSGNNTITNNDIVDNAFGMYLDSENNLLRLNKMHSNVYNFVNYWDVLPFSRMQDSPLINDIDATNLINGKRLYYLLNQSDLNINPSTYPDAGYLVVRNCTNIKIENMSFSNNGVGLAFHGCSNITIANVTVNDNLVGISATDLTDSEVRNSVFQRNLHGCQVIDGENITISNNVILNNTIHQLLSKVSSYLVLTQRSMLELTVSYMNRPISNGIYLELIRNSTIIDNLVSQNEIGIYLVHVSYNVFKNNTMTNNTYNFGVGGHLWPLFWDGLQTSPYLTNDVDTSNTVDGKPIYWWINRQYEQVPSDAGYVILVNCTKMMMKNLVLQNNFHGALLAGVSDSLISNNTIRNTGIGIFIRGSYSGDRKLANNLVSGNKVTKSGVGIRAIILDSMVSNNILKNNLAGMDIYSFGNVTIAKNLVVNNTNPPLDEWVFGYPFHAYGWGHWGWPEWFVYYKNGVGIISSVNSTIRDNMIRDNYYGIYVWGGNKIYHNNFINNNEHVLPWERGLGNNIWDNGYPNGGNYWSNYNGTDLYKGPNQDQPGSDGIGDTPQIIDENNRDNFPLTGMFSNLNATSEQQVQVICNSTLSDFQFNGTAICFNVTGAEGTTGFCRICIPRALISNAYRIFVNGTEVSYSLLPCSNNTHNYLYFTYGHSTQEVVIITELPSTLVLPLFTSITLIATILIKKKEKQ